MNLWIRSQDNNTLINATMVEIRYNIKPEIIGYTYSGCTNLGTYESEEIAKTILEEIMIVATSNTINFYQMPKE